MASVWQLLKRGVCSGTLFSESVLVPRAINGRQDRASATICLSVAPALRLPPVTMSDGGRATLVAPQLGSGPAGAS